MTPPPTDEQQAMQQKVMKYMMVFLGLMFYKVAAGLCIYFIASSLWGFADETAAQEKTNADRWRRGPGHQRQPAQSSDGWRSGDQFHHGSDGGSTRQGQGGGVAVGSVVACRPICRRKVARASAHPALVSADSEFPFGMVGRSAKTGREKER